MPGPMLCKHLGSASELTRLPRDYEHQVANCMSWRWYRSHKATKFGVDSLAFHV